MSSLATVLFVCVHNSARSQMAESFLNNMCQGSIKAKSAGVSAGQLNPLTIEVMREIGIDISRNLTKEVFSFFRSGERFDAVIGLCDEANGERCPILPGTYKRIDWNFEDPAAAEGSLEEQLAAMRSCRDQIRSRIEEWCADVCAKPDSEPPRGGVSFYPKARVNGHTRDDWNSAPQHAILR